MLADSLPPSGASRELASNGSTGKWSALYRQFICRRRPDRLPRELARPNDRAAAIEKEIKALGRPRCRHRAQPMPSWTYWTASTPHWRTPCASAPYSAALDK